MRKFKISYYYLASGMEGKADEHPELTIEAPDKETAAYIYYILFGYHYDTSFIEFGNLDEINKFWGLTIKELSEGL